MTLSLIPAAFALAVSPPAPLATIPGAAVDPPAEADAGEEAGAAAELPADPLQEPLDPASADPADPAADAGDIVVTASPRIAGDPLAVLNAQSFAVTQKFDAAITEPIARGYEHAVPHGVRKGLHNFLANLHEPVVFANYLLQHKVGKALETAGRFVVNTTVGFAGVTDAAAKKPFNLPRRPNSFADTMGFYGVKPGAFFFVPLVGPTTVRDLVGKVLDKALLPVGIGPPLSGPQWTVPTGLVHTLDKRAEFDEQLSCVRASDDPYTAAREYYLERRQAEIDALHGKGGGKGSVDACAVPPDGAGVEPVIAAGPAPAERGDPAG